MCIQITDFEVLVHHDLPISLEYTENLPTFREDPRSWIDSYVDGAAGETIPSRCRR